MGASLLLISTPSPRSSLVLPRAPCKCDPAFRAKRQQRPICLGFPRLKGRKSSCYRRTDPRCSSGSASAVTSSSSSSSSERWVLDPAGSLQPLKTRVASNSEFSAACSIAALRCLTHPRLVDPVIARALIGKLERSFLACLVSSQNYQLIWPVLAAVANFR
jgi:hypothetical protein